MIGISVQEVVNRELQIPHLLVLGAGNTIHGVTVDTARNARAASSLMINSLAPHDFTITAGYGPDTGQWFPKSEAEVMANIIGTNLRDHGLNSEIYVEDKSRDTIANIDGIAQVLEELEVDALAVIAAKGHADRASMIGRKILGKKVEIIPVYSKVDISKQSRIKEFGLAALYKGLTFGAQEGSYELNRAHNRYRKTVRFPKKIVSTLKLSDRYSG